MSIIVIVLLITCLAGCHPQAQSAAPAPQRPLRVALLYDISGSAAFHHLPEVNETLLRRLLDLVGEVGGEVAFGTIPHPADRGLVRARLSPKPRQPSDSGNIFERAREARAYKEALAAWEQETRRRKEAFCKEAVALLGPRQRRGTPLFQSMRLALDFLSEPGATRLTGLKALVLVSDCGETAGQAPPPSLPRDVHLLVIRGSSPLAEKALGHLHPRYFGDLEAALNFIQQLKEEESHAR